MRIVRQRIAMRHLSIGGACLLACLSSAPAARAQATLSVGVMPAAAALEADNGAQLDLFSVPVTTTLWWERVAFRTALPYLQLKATAPAADIGGPWLRLPIGGQTISEQGPGDLVVAPSVLLRRGGSGGVWIWGDLEVKLPTADREKYLGTGKLDYAPAIGVQRLLGARGLLSGTLRYTVRGDPPDIDLEDSLVASVGGGVRLGARSALLTSVARSGSPYTGRAPVWTGALSWHHALRQDYALRAGAFLSRAPEGDGYGVALGFTYRLDPFAWGT